MCCLVCRTWPGLKPGLDDPLADDSHSLRHEDWRPLTSAGMPGCCQADAEPAQMVPVWHELLITVDVAEAVQSTLRGCRVLAWVTGWHVIVH
jgi:hypothetical protein